MEQAQSWTMKSTICTKIRPSLRHTLSVIQASSLKNRLVDNQPAGGDLDRLKFDAFCNIVRFPNCMSHLLRIRCYLLAAQGHNFDFTKHTIKLVSNDIAKVSLHLTLTHLH